MFCAMHLNYRKALPQHNINADNYVHVCTLYSRNSEVTAVYTQKQNHVVYSIA